MLLELLVGYFNHIALTDGHVTLYRIWISSVGWLE